MPVCYKKCIPWCGEIDGEARADGKKHPSLRPSTKGIARASRAQPDIDRGEHCGGLSELLPRKFLDKPKIGTTC